MKASKAPNFISAKTDWGSNHVLSSTKYQYERKYLFSQMFTDDGKKWEVSYNQANTVFINDKISKHV